MRKKKKEKISIYEDDFLTVSEISKKEEPEKLLKEEKKKKENKPKKKESLRGKALFKCIIVAVIIGLALAFAVIDTGFIGNIKDKISDFFKKEDNITFDSRIGNTFDSSSKMVPFENASTSAISWSKSGLVIAKSNYLALFDKSGNTLWDTNTSVIEPILRTEGDFILLAEKQGKRICLFKDKKLLFSTEAPNEILTAQLSANGDIVLVTKKEFYKNAICVYNEKGEQVFSWSSGTDSIISADISSSSRRVAASLINTDARVKSYVMFFDINKTEPYHNIEFTESIVFKTQFIGETLHVVADNRITGIETDGEVLWDLTYTDRQLILTEADIDGNRITSIEKNNIPSLIVLDPDADVDTTINLDVSPDYGDIKDETLIYNNGRIVIFGKPRKLGRYITSMDIKGLKVTSDESFVVVYNNSIEFVVIK